MKYLKTLVLMQLKDKLDLSFMGNRRKLILKSALAVLSVVAVTAVIFLLFKVAVMLRIFSFWDNLPVNVLSVVFIAMQLLSMIGCTVGLTNALYFATDNKVLLTMPVSTNTVFLSKLTLYYIYELKKSILFTLPLFVAFGMVNGYAFYYYLWLIPCIFLVSLVPVAVASVVSIPLMFVMRVIKNGILRGVLCVLGLAAITFVIVKLIALIPENINLVGQWGEIYYAIQDALQWVCDKFALLNYITVMVVGQTVGYVYKLFSLQTFVILAVLVASMAVLIGISYLLARPLFLYMASKQFEFEKNNNVKAKPNKVHSAKTSAISQELTMNFRSLTYIVKVFGQITVLPVATFFLNKTFVAMNTRLAGQHMAVAFNVLLMLLISTSQNSVLASVYSREGNARYIIKTRPVSYANSVVAKLYVNLVATTLSVVLATVGFANVTGTSVTDSVLLAVIVVFVNIAYIFWSAELDIMNPQSRQYSTVGVSFDNPNERKATVLSFLISALFAFAVYFLLKEGQTMAFIKIGLVALVFLGARLYLYFTRVKLYYMEK